MVVLGAALLPFVIATVAGLVVLWPGEPQGDALEGSAPDDLVRAVVVSAERGPCEGTPEEAGVACNQVVVRLLEPAADVVRRRCPAPDPAGGCEVDEVREVIPGLPAGEVTALPEQSEAGAAARLDVGDEVVLGYFAGAGEGFELSFADLERRRPLALLAGIFVVAVVALGRWKGLRALVGLALSLLVLTVFVLPAVLEGADPLAVALVGSSAIALTALYLAHGLSARTTAAVLGTLLSLGLVGVLSAVFVDLARFTGLADEEATFLQVFAGQIDLRGLLLGGFVIGALGVLDDVTVTQVSAVWELKHANPGYRFRDLYGSAVRIGRDHIASTVNTLVLAYAGASLPLLLLFTQAGQGLSDVVNGEAVAIEIVRTLCGSIGLVAAVPFTTAVAALVVARDPVVAGDTPGPAVALGAPPGPGEVAAGPDAAGGERGRGVLRAGGDDPADPRAARSRRERRFWTRG